MREFLRRGGRWPWAAALIALLVVGCGGGGGGGGGGVPAGSFSATIGPAGGTITADSGPLDGTVLEIPAGAVATDTTFTMSPGTDIVTTIGSQLVGPSIEISPSGTVFGPGLVTLKVPFDITKIPAGQGPARMEVLHRDDVGVVTNLPVVDLPSGEDAVVVEVPSLSTFQPTLPPLTLSGPWLYAVVDGELSLVNPPTQDDVDVGNADLIQDLETGEVTLLPTGVVDANSDPVTFTGTFSGNRVSLSASYVGDEGQVTEEIDLEFLSDDVGYGTITETLLGQQPTMAQMGVFRVNSLDAPTYTTNPLTVWDLEIVGGAPSDNTLPSSDLEDAQTTARIIQLPQDPETGLTGVTMFLTSDLLNPFVGTVTGELYVLARQREVGGGTLVEVLSFTRVSDTEFASGIGVAPGFAFYWGEGTIENPPADISAGNYGAGNATLIGAF